MAFKSALTSKLYEDRLFIYEADEGLVTDQTTEYEKLLNMFKNFKLDFGINRMMLLTSEDCGKEIRNVARNKMTDLVDVKLVNVKNIISSPYIGIRSDLLGVLGVTLKEK